MEELHHINSQVAKLGASTFASHEWEHDKYGLQPFHDTAKNKLYHSQAEISELSSSESVHEPEVEIVKCTPEIGSH